MTVSDRTDTRTNEAKNGALYIRFRTKEELAPLREIADRDFEGNLSMAIRKAVREFVDSYNAKTPEEQLAS